MKGRLVCCTILLLMCVFANATLLLANCSYENETFSAGQEIIRNCLRITCSGENQWSALGTRVPHTNINVTYICDDEK